jgi:hypothetical protein
MRYLLIFPLLLSLAFAQLKPTASRPAPPSLKYNPDNLLMRYGYGMEVYSGVENVPASTNDLFPRAYNSIQLDGYYAAFHKNDVASIGLNSGLGFSIRPNGIKPDMMLQVPLRVGARLGAMSTKYNSQPVGLGVSGGLLYQYVQSSFSVAGGALYRNSMSYVAPDVSADIAINFRNTSLIGRVHFSPVSIPTSLKIVEAARPNSAKVDVRAQNIGFGLMYAF